MCYILGDTSIGLDSLSNQLEDAALMDVWDEPETDLRLERMQRPLRAVADAGLSSIPIRMQGCSVTNSQD